MMLKVELATTPEELVRSRTYTTPSYLHRAGSDDGTRMVMVWLHAPPGDGGHPGGDTLPTRVMVAWTPEETTTDSGLMEEPAGNVLTKVMASGPGELPEPGWTIALIWPFNKCCANMTPLNRTSVNIRIEAPSSLVAPQVKSNRDPCKSKLSNASWLNRK